jgi:hypothetical protein
VILGFILENRLWKVSRDLYNKYQNCTDVSIENSLNAHADMCILLEFVIT